MRTFGCFPRLAAARIALAAIACLALLAGCSGGGGLGAGTAPVKATVTQLPGTGFLSRSTLPSRTIGFDDAITGGGDPIHGVAVRVVQRGGDLDVEAIATNAQGQMAIYLSAGTYVFTVRGAVPDEAISFPLLIEGPASVVMRVRLERDGTGILLNAEAITDSNNDNVSDDGFRIRITGQRPSGGGTLIIHHSNGANVPASKRNLRITASLDASGGYTVVEQFIDSDDDGIPDP
jgi:hypothetical protein